MSRIQGNSIELKKQVHSSVLSPGKEKGCLYVLEKWFFTDHLQHHHGLRSLLSLNEGFWASLQSYLGPGICIYQAPQVILEWDKAVESQAGVQNLNEKARRRKAWVFIVPMSSVCYIVSFLLPKITSLRETGRQRFTQYYNF